VRGAGGQSHGRTATWTRRGVVAGRRRGDGQTTHRAAPGHDLDSESVRVGGRHDASTTRPAEFLDRGELVAGGEPIEFLDRVRGECQPDEARVVAEVGDVHESLVVGAAHVERLVGSRGARQAEVDEERLHLVEVGRPEPDECDVVDLDAHRSSFSRRRARGGRRSGRSGSSSCRSRRSSSRSRRRPAGTGGRRRPPRPVCR